MYHRRHQPIAKTGSGLTPAHQTEAPAIEIAARPGLLAAVRAGSPAAQAERLSRASGGRLHRAGQPLLQLQHGYGNRYVQQVVHHARQTTNASPPPVIQTKLLVGPADDKYERQADRVAQQVVRDTGREPTADSVSIRKPEVQRLASAKGGAVEPDVQQGIQQARGHGQVIPKHVRAPMEQALAADFRGLRLHTDTQADQLNRSLHARAFTTAQDIFFRRGEYSPHTSAGRHTLAHELTHVIQQGGASLQPKSGDRERHTAPAVQRTYQCCPALDGPALGLQPTRGNPAGLNLIQRRFEDKGKTGEGPIESRGPAEEETAIPVVTERNEFGELDGEIGSNVEPQAFKAKGRVREDRWHHCGGDGGQGNESCGTATLVAPVYKTAPVKNGKRARAWIEDGTGKVTVKRSYTGVPSGDQGKFSAPPFAPDPGTIWMTRKAAARVDKHEGAHDQKTREIHDTYIKPLEDRIKKYQEPFRSEKKAATESAAQTALQTEIDWNNSVTSFQTEDIRENTPMGPVDTTDMATADFYKDYGSRKVKGTDYGAYFDVPPGPKRDKPKPKRADVIENEAGEAVEL